MFHVKLWIPLLVAVPLAVAAAGFQGPGPVPSESSEDQEVQVPIGGTATETNNDQEPWLDPGGVVERWQALGGFFDPAAKAAFRGSVSPAESDYVTDVGARLSLPGREALKEIPRKRVDYYLQFDGPLSAVERREYVLERAYAYTAAGDVPREMVGAIEDHGIVAANCSFGTITGWEDGDDGGNHYRFGRYDTLAGLYDHVVLGKKLLLQVAAGNDGNDCNAAGTECDGVQGDDGIRYHTIPEEANAKNSVIDLPMEGLGECPVTIIGFEIVQAGADYSVDLLPTLPIVLQPGEVLGEDDLALVFAPLDVARHSDAEIRVTYVTNLPGVGDTETLTRRLCGESTRTGVRVLVTEDDLPVAEVKHVNFCRVYYPGTVDEALSIITLENDRPLMTVDEDSPCAGFQYHREWGAVTDPMILDPATYRVNVKIINAAGYLQTKIVQFELDYCEFWHDLRIDY